MMAVHQEYTAVGLWAAASALAALALIYTASFAFVGVLIAIPMFLWLGRHASPGRARHGVLLGAAILPAWLAWYHRDYQSCPATATDMADGIWQCGGTNPAPFAVAAALLVAGFAIVWMTARPDHPSRVDFAPA